MYKILRFCDCYQILRCNVKHVWLIREETRRLLHQFLSGNQGSSLLLLLYMSYVSCFGSKTSKIRCRDIFPSALQYPSCKEEKEARVGVLQSPEVENNANACRLIPNCAV